MLMLGKHIYMIVDVFSEDGSKCPVDRGEPGKSKERKGKAMSKSIMNG